jgi:hypothetical protein
VVMVVCMAVPSRSLILGVDVSVVVLP